MQKIFAALTAVPIRDIAGVLGATLIVCGVWLIHPPTALIVAGLMLLSATLLLARGEG